MKIAMIGAGYVGLTTSAGLSAMGHAVTCHDADTTRVERLLAGEIPIYEPGLEEIVRSSCERGTLRFSPSMVETVEDADAVFLAVGTPSGADGAIDLSFIEAAATQVAPLIRSGTVVVVKSTVVVGTAQRLRRLIARKRGANDFSVASNPEFLREGSAVRDFLEPDRIVVGSDDRRAADLLESLYRPMADQGVPIVATTTANAELIKYAANAFLALKIGFINDVAGLCEATGGDVRDVARGIGFDPRIGPSFLAPGPGFGGSCFPKDTRAFAATGQRHGAPQMLIEALLRSNEQRKDALARRIITDGGLSRGMTVAVLGLAFKANTDDTRDSAALTMIPILQQAGLRVRAHDPRATDNARGVLSNVVFCATPEEAARGADAVVVLTEWDEYRKLDLARLAAAMKGNALFDYRNLYSAEAAARVGLDHVGIGRAARLPHPLKRSVGGGAVAGLEAAAARPSAS